MPHPTWAVHAILVSIAFTSVEAQDSWVYTVTPGGAADPVDQLKTWSSFPTCASGREQSPIDILVEDVAEAPTLDGAIKTMLEKVPILPINTGHGFQVHETSPDHAKYVSAGPGGQFVKQTTEAYKGHSYILNQKYNFYQVHWHTPSENTINGEFFPLEAHFVHQLDDGAYLGKESLVGTLSHLAVIGVMYELSDECDPDLDLFWDAFPIDSSKARMAPSEVAVNFNDMLEDIVKDGFYHWDGSLTTPPCTEGVSWNLMKQRLKVCQRQVSRLQEALGNSQQGVTVNNRVVQPLYQRVVVGTTTISKAPQYKAATYFLAPLVLVLAFSLAALLYRGLSSNDAQAEANSTTRGDIPLPAANDNSRPDVVVKD
uniref:Carbonic anhydrase n=2 Tax=Chrysotila carterae TaxID=13221 RepID=A0A7S4BN06_CHRCT